MYTATERQTTLQRTNTTGDKQRQLTADTNLHTVLASARHKQGRGALIVLDVTVDHVSKLGRARKKLSIEVTVYSMC